MAKLSKSYLKTIKQEKESDFSHEFEVELNRIVLQESSSCEDVEFIMRALELDRCPYCLAYFGEDEILKHNRGTH